MMSNDPLVQRVTYSLLKTGNVLQDIPLMDNKTLKAQGVRFRGAGLPAVNWGQVNKEPTVTKGKPEPWQENVFVIRNSIDVDKMYVEDKNAIVDPRGAQIQAYLQAVTYEVNDKFVNNDHVTGDSNAPVGLRYRLDNPADWGPESEMKINGGGVDLSQSGLTATTANNFIELVDQLLAYMGAKDGNGVVIYVNDVLERRFARAIRTLGAGAGFEMTTDAFDRPVARYRNAVIRDLGRKADQSTRIISTTENSDGTPGSSTYTSLYATLYGEDYFGGWQWEPFTPRDLGLLDNGVIYRTVFDWAFGLYQIHSRAIARVYNIKLA
jgi:hypothetical protein